MKLLLGCGGEAREGWVCVDKTLHSPHVDQAVDLNGPWLWPAGSVEAIEAIDVLEHLDDFIAFFDKCHKTLAPGGRLWVRTVHSTSPNCWRDPTHRRGYEPDCFLYLCDGNFYGDKYGRYYTQLRWRIVSLDANGDWIAAVMEPIK